MRARPRGGRAPGHGSEPRRAGSLDGPGGFTARPLRWFCGAGGAVVVEQEATWADPATGAERGRAVVASRFLVADGVITHLQRHDEGLPAALAAAGLRRTDEVTARAG